MKIAVIYPPHAEPEVLPLGAVRLAAGLAAAGHAVTLHDANQDAWARWLDPARLRAAVPALAAQRDRLAAAPSLHGADAWAYLRCLRGSVGADLVADALPGAMAEIAAPGDGAARGRAKRIIEAALDVALWPLEGRATLNDLTMPCSTESSGDMANAAGRAEAFAGFWSDWWAAIGAMPDCVVLWLDADQQLVPVAVLAKLLARHAPRVRLVADGPLAAFLQRCADAGAAPLAHLGIEAGAGLPAMAPTELAQAWLARWLEQRRLGAPVAAVVAPADTCDQQALVADLRLLRAAAPGLRVHLGSPWPWQALRAVAEQAGLSEGWSACVRFGFDVDTRGAAALRALGCRALHFEVKGRAGYDGPVAEAIDTMLGSFGAARAAGLATLGSLVYGFPRDDDASFGRVATALGAESAAVDQWVRWRTWRLYRFSPPWHSAPDHGIAGLHAPPAERDWHRHCNFVTTQGEDSRQHAERAWGWRQAFPARPQDFPASALVSDDAGLATSCTARPRVTAPRDGRVEAVPGDAAVPTPYNYAALDQRYGPFVPAAGLPWPEDRFDAGTAQWVARGFDADRVCVISGGVAQLLARCRPSAPATTLAAQLARGGADGQAQLARLLQAGLVRTCQEVVR